MEKSRKFHFFAAKSAEKCARHLYPTVQHGESSMRRRCRLYGAGAACAMGPLPMAAAVLGPRILESVPQAQNHFSCA